MDALKEHVFATIADVVSHKRGKVHPATALYVKDLIPILAGYNRNDIMQALQDLCKEKRIGWGRTINDKYFIPI